MKKGRIFLSLLSAVAMCLSSISVAVMAEDYQETAEYQEESESETEHPSTYYEAIQTNDIEDWPEGPAIDSDAAIVMDAKTGTILYGKNIEKQEYPASITKIMTVLLALENGNLEDTVTFSANAVYSIEYGSAHLGLTEGEELTLEQCLYGIMLASANEISNAVAEHIGGSIENFADMMNAKAKELGCKNTHFVNPNGLFDSDHYTCAKDMALIMRAALKYDKFREIIHTQEYYYPETNLVDEKRYFVNHHAMLYEDQRYYDGIIGGKTGYTDECLNTLVTAVKRDKLELISVVLRAPGLESEYGDTRTILDYGYDNFEICKVNNNDQVKHNLEITGIEDPEEIAKIKAADLTQEPFTIGEKANVVIPKDAKTEDLLATMNFDKGKLVYTYNGQRVGATSFTYSGIWEEETESETEELLTETETETETEAVPVLEGKSIVEKILALPGFLYEKMDDFIKENTVFSAVLGAVLLLVFLPLLFIASSRNRKYKKLMRLREEDQKIRQQLEWEIEQKSAAQVEAELRARDLEQQLEEEKRLRKEAQESMEYFDEEDLTDEESAEGKDKDTEKL
ncbi:MAG: hypothetical protein ACI4EI_13990 [Muricoprocola sp.]